MKFAFKILQAIGIIILFGLPLIIGVAVMLNSNPMSTPQYDRGGVYTGEFSPALVIGAWAEPFWMMLIAGLFWNKIFVEKPKEET